MVSKILGVAGFVLVLGIAGASDAGRLGMAAIIAGAVVGLLMIVSAILVERMVYNG